MDFTFSPEQDLLRREIVDGERRVAIVPETVQKLVKAGFAVGIGSAAIVAALLYASKVKKTPDKKK